MTKVALLAALALVALAGCAYDRRAEAQRAYAYGLMVSDTHAARHALARRARRLLDAADYDGLDRMADELRRSRALAADGAWKLRYLYKDTFGSSDDHGDAAWKPLITELEGWVAARPRSITAPVALAHAWIGYAWDARTGKPARDVGVRHWVDFSARLSKASEVLEQASRLPERCPCWYLAAQNLALGQGWSRAAYDSLFTEAIHAEPGFDTYYEFKAMYLQPRWYGEPGEWQRFALESAHGLPDSAGARRYARIIWNLFLHHRGLLKQEEVSWPLARQGFETLLAEHPESLETMSTYCWLACQAKDRETARRLFDRIGRRLDLDTWMMAVYFADNRRWAMGRS